MRDLIRQKLVDALATPTPIFTRRTVRLPGVPGKAVAVIGPRRAGKTTFLWQILADRLESGVPREGLVYFNFEDSRRASVGRRRILHAVPGVARPAAGRVLPG
jgi:hypothetical protein